MLSLNAQAEEEIRDSRIRGSTLKLLDQSEYCVIFSELC